MSAKKKTAKRKLAAPKNYQDLQPTLKLVNSNLKTELYTTVSGKIVRDMGTEYSSGLMGLVMRENGLIIKRMGEVLSFMLMVMFSKENGLSIKRMVMELTTTPTEASMRASG